MIQLIKKFWKNEDGFSYTEIIVVLVILATLVLFIVPGQIKNINDSKRETDLANAELIGQAAESIIQNNDRFKDYTIKKLIVGKELATSSDTLDDDFINALIKELDQFDIKKIPSIQYKKGGYDQFSVTITEDKVYVYADNVENDASADDIQLYPNIEEKE